MMYRAGTVLDGHALILQLCRVKNNDRVKEKVGEDQSSTKLIVRNVAFEATEKELRQLFSPFGQVKSLRLPTRFGKHIGFAFVEYVTKQETKNALQALSNLIYMGVICPENGGFAICSHQFRNHIYRFRTICYTIVCSSMAPWTLAGPLPFHHRRLVGASIQIKLIQIETVASLFLLLEASTIRFPETLKYHTLLLLLPAFILSESLVLFQNPHLIFFNYGHSFKRYLLFVWVWSLCAHLHQHAHLPPDQVWGFLKIFLLRIAGFLLPCYIMVWAISILQRRRQQQELEWRLFGMQSITAGFGRVSTMLALGSLSYFGGKEHKSYSFDSFSSTGSMNPMIWTMVPPPFQQMAPAPWFPPLRFHLKAMDVEDSCVITHVQYKLFRIHVSKNKGRHKGGVKHSSDDTGSSVKFVSCELCLTHPLCLSLFLLT
ncbi:putative RNA recognition motif domain, nucleotide-binding alpha-beta plait domain superfamily [Helianthus annuus]|nr:putative RNA recognition motif domain, nucleotide-binding alpha-beta plait domain superfamily [Helianthus annuus]